VSAAVSVNGRSGSDDRRVPMVVGLRGFTWDTIASDDFRDDRECGWFLFGNVGDVEIEVFKAAPAQRGTHVGEPNKITPDVRYAGELEAALHAADCPWNLCGFLHSHPSGPVEPSRQDLVGARDWAAKLHHSVAEIIVGPNPDTPQHPWAYPIVRAWIVDQQGVDRPSGLILERSYI
jgi:proteasome lid subunit RPN8/RPN11